jgi:hypothetical protein
VSARFWFIANLPVRQTATMVIDTMHELNISHHDMQHTAHVHNPQFINCMSLGVADHGASIVDASIPSDTRCKMAFIWTDSHFSYCQKRLPGKVPREVKFLARLIGLVAKRHQDW